MNALVLMGAAGIGLYFLSKSKSGATSSVKMTPMGQTTFKGNSGNTWTIKNFVVQSSKGAGIVSELYLGTVKMLSFEQDSNGIRKIFNVTSAANPQLLAAAKADLKLT